MRQEIAWVCGVSASGKHTFLTKALVDAPSRFSYPENVKASKQSLITEKTKRNSNNISKEIETLVYGGFSPVLKYQWPDITSSNNIPYEAKARFPMLMHRITMLFIPYSIQKERLKQRFSKGEKPHSLNEKIWKSTQHLLLEGLKKAKRDGFHTQFIDSTDGYKILSKESVVELCR